MIISSSPKEPTLIDLPTVSETDNVKQSHKDFYKNDNEDLEKPKEDKTLLQQKFKELDSAVARTQK